MVTGLDGKIYLYTNDNFLAQGVAALTMQLRDYAGGLRLPFDVAVIDNRVSNHAIRLIEKKRRRQFMPVIWLYFEPFYAWQCTTDDYFVNGRLGLEAMVAELSGALFRICCTTRSKVYVERGECRLLPPAERRAVCSSLREVSTTAYARSINRSPKTIYAQRLAVAKKLGFNNYKEMAVWIISKERLVINPLFCVTLPSRTISPYKFERELIKVPYVRGTRPQEIDGADILIPWGGGARNDMRQLRALLRLVTRISKKQDLPPTLEHYLELVTKKSPGDRGNG